jgi:hypothetical protein
MEMPYPGWYKAKDIQRGWYIGMPVPHTVVSDTADETHLTKQLQCLCAGVIRSIRGGSLDDESSPGDARIDEHFVWFRVHDIECTREPGLFMYETDMCIANNVCCMDLS